MKQTKFQRWLAAQPHGTRARIIREAAASPSTVQRLTEGGHVRSVDAAERISKATGGAVTVASLMGVR